MTESEEFREGLLLALLEGARPLLEAFPAAQDWAASRHGTRRDLSYKTLKNAKGRMVSDGLLEQYRQGGHFWLRLTDAGEAATASLPEPVADAGDLPPAPFRASGVGQHRLPRRRYGEVLERWKSGELDAVFVPAAARTRVPYWDEA